MKRDLKKYQDTAFSLLIVLTINVVLPAALHAIDLYCQVENSSQVAVGIPSMTEDCCPAFETENVDAPSDNQEQINRCSFEQVCKLLSSDSFLELYSLLPAEKLLAKAVLPAPFFDKIFPDKGIFSYISPHSLISFPTPPLFLLNSSFLN